MVGMVVTLDLLTWPKTTCLPSSQLVLAVQMKNLHRADYLRFETGSYAVISVEPA